MTNVPVDPTPAEKVSEANHSLHDLLMQIRYDLTAAQGKLTEALRQVAALPHQGKIETAHDRAIARARANLEAGMWLALTPDQLDIEFDDLGIAHTDRAQLHEAHAHYRARFGHPAAADTGDTAKARPTDG